MTTVGVKDLKAKASEIVEWATSGESFIITRRGRPVAAVVPIDTDEYEDYILSSSKQIARDLADADRSLAAGKARPADEVFARLRARKRRKT
jgi:prevent-host-death family protein